MFEKYTVSMHALRSAKWVLMKKSICIVSIYSICFFTCMNWITQNHYIYAELSMYGLGNYNLMNLWLTETKTYDPCHLFSNSIQKMFRNIFNIKIWWFLPRTSKFQDFTIWLLLKITIKVCVFSQIFTCVWCVSS